MLGVGDALACLAVLSQNSYRTEAYDLMDTLLKLSEEEKGLPRL